MLKPSVRFAVLFLLSLLLVFAPELCRAVLSPLCSRQGARIALHIRVTQSLPY